MTRLVVVGAWFATALISLGCTAIQPRVARIDSIAAGYENVTINYRVDTRQYSGAVGAQRDNTQSGLSSSGDGLPSVARLNIQYPHPEGKAGFGLAEVIIESTKPSQAPETKPIVSRWLTAFGEVARDVLPGVRLSEGVDEAWAMDLPRGEIDRILSALSQHGYFARASRPPQPGIDLAARVDRFQAAKPWRREPELDVLLERVRQEGQLVSYIRPDGIGPRPTAFTVARPAPQEAAFAAQRPGPPNRQLGSAPPIDGYANVAMRPRQQAWSRPANQAGPAAFRRPVAPSYQPRP